MPSHYCQNSRDLETLDKVANKVKFYQQHFVRQGFVQPDQENWIDFKEHQAGMGSIVDFLHDVCIQHNWLAENVIQLVEELDKSKEKEKENNKQISQLQESSDLLKSIKERDAKISSLKSDLATQESIHTQIS